MYETLKENTFSGFETFPVIVKNKYEEEITGYHGLSTIGRCGPINYELSQIVEKSFIPNGPKCNIYRGFYVGLDKWDGTDLFLPQKSFSLIVTRRVAMAIQEVKLTNISLVNLADIETPEFGISGKL